MIETPIENGSSSAGIFTGLRGTMMGSLKYSADDRLLKFSANILGSGGTAPVVKTDAGAKGGFPDVILKLKVTKGALFTQEGPL